MVLRVIVAVFVVLALVLVGLVVYSYAQIDVEVQGLESVSPVYDVGLESATSAARQVLLPGTKHVVFLGSRPEDAYERAPGNPVSGLGWPNRGRSRLASWS